MKYYIKISEEGTVRAVPVTKEDKLQFWYDNIGCSLVDIVEAHFLGEPYSIVCDDEALLRDSKLNIVASILYGYHQHGQPLFGNVIVGQDVMTEDGISVEPFTEEGADDCIGEIQFAIASYLAESEVKE